MTKDNIYDLTPAEKRLIEVLINPEHMGKNIKDLCNLANVSRNKYYESMRKDYFKRILRETSVDLVESKINDILNATYRYALDKNGHQDRKLLLTMAGLNADRLTIEKTKAEIELLKKKIEAIEGGEVDYGLRETLRETIEDE